MTDLRRILTIILALSVSALLPGGLPFAPATEGRPQPACVTVDFLEPTGPGSNALAVRPDFSNVRGLNYIASYAPSDVAMWRFYDGDRIDRELKLVAGLGANSLRVWLAWVVYDVEGDRFVQGPPAMDVHQPGVGRRPGGSPGAGQGTECGRGGRRESRGSERC
jgi:hypothetical protein